ncbi:hypothetical protein C7974DRAFT_454951 [Boeremia exigua]|uniref:uncharacterized protein n=1 Tax=Boeremia exigua TaxID=749465 RepID=UPI001E8CEF5F|nr:uncharacterized protein C7974DRAFT_445619 [Boeremia exigua]XP_045997644.1 uncharacterized protein C7974DRAFT_454951 [Boeremia exigua]KAH6612775.1 hypothetical protein C7974DRAFT_445619 [Boeremia exigua]KAH6629876.1 hypothetical protein C7974DRAFT_454951 [Boeremia exigua]
MPSPNENAAASDLGIFVMLMATFFVMAFAARGIARRALFPPVHRFLLRWQQAQQRQQQQQQLQELDRQRRLHAHLEEVRYNEEVARVRDLIIRQLQEDPEYREWVEQLESYAATRQQGPREQQPFQPAPGSLLYESDNEDPEVIRGDNMAGLDRR